MATRQWLASRAWYIFIRMSIYTQSTWYKTEFRNFRSPRWTSGSPRVLLALVLEFESRRGEVLKLLAKIRKDQLLRAPTRSVSRLNSTRVDEEKKGWSLAAIKMKGADRNPSGEGGHELAMWPRIWVTTINWREIETKGEDNKWDEKINAYVKWWGTQCTRYWYICLGLAVC